MTKKISKSVVICVGAQKAGTSWLYKCLEEHPEVCAATGKETNFFVTGNKNLDTYSSYFSECKNRKVWFESSPLYLYDKKASNDIKNAFENIKIIILLREPIDRTFSHFRHLISRGYISKKEDIEKATKKYPNLLKHSNYSKFVPLYVDEFGDDNVLLIDFEQISNDPKNVIKKVCAFMDINSFEPSFLNVKYNTSSARANSLYYTMTRIYLKLRRNKVGTAFITFLKHLGIDSKRLEQLLSNTATRKKTTDNHSSDSNKIYKLLNEEIEFYNSFAKDYYAEKS